jgi:hypothetical protein
MFKRTMVGGLSALLALSLSIDGAAQRRRVTAKKAEAKASETKADDESPVPNQIISGASYLPGELRVHVKTDQTPVVRIGMALSGVTIIEFPESDKFFAVHPPENGDLVRVERSPSIRADHHLVLRAGQDLTKGQGPSASVTVQMQSGLNVVLWVYMVKNVTQQTHRCLFLYDRAEIVAGRRKTGLAVNLGEEEIKPQPATPLIAGAAPSHETETAPQSAAAPEPVAESEPKPASAEESAQANASEGSSPVKPEAPDTPLTKEVKKALQEVIEEPRKFKKWTSATNGLSVASRSKEYDEGTRIALVAIKNIQKEPLRILPGNPELIVETTDEKGKAIQLTPIKKRYVETNAAGNLIPGYGVVYYAIAYTPPILGKQQKVRVSVGQRNAADAPAGGILGAVK